MPTTTNYGWTTPADTDLVKDGASAIRTLGNSVDTTTKALNPQTTLGDLAYRSATSNTNTRLPIGTTGQVLTVASGVPSWATPTDQTPLTTKGDLFTFSTLDARLGVGANGTVLTADSAEATGLKWATPSNAFTSLASGSLSGSAVTISSISSAYTNLFLIINAPDQTVLIDDDSGNNFDGYILESQTNNAAINTVTQLNTGNIYPSYNGVGTSQVQIICQIYNYANTTARKLYNLLASGGNNCDSAQWASRSTAAISQLSINAAAGSFAAGTYTLYGVK